MNRKGEIRKKWSAAIFLIVTLFSFSAFAKYSGGSGEPNTPYQIADVNDLMTLANDTNDYNKCFILTADIDLDTKNQIFTTAVIAPDDTDPLSGGFQGTAFTGIFDGNGKKIMNLRIDTAGAENDYLGLFGQIGHASPAAQVKNLGMVNAVITGGTNSYNLGGLCGINLGTISNCYASGSEYGDGFLGGLCAENSGTISNCCADGKVTSNSWAGGLCGSNSGTISNCYTSGSVSGILDIGGLCGSNWGTISNCYATGNVTGYIHKGGFCGDNNWSVTGCFWDMQTSGMTTSDGGTGKTTAQMKTLSTFTNVGWDFLGEMINGYEDIWRLCNEGLEYPKLKWEFLPGDFICPDGVDIFDLAELCEQWLVSEIPADLAPPPSGDGIVNFADFSVFASQWRTINDINDLLDFSRQWLKTGIQFCSADIAPQPNGDGKVDAVDFTLMAENWLQ
jgi:hypothetical protein